MLGRRLALVVFGITSASAFTLTFQNNCDQTVWPAVGLAPSGRPDNKFSWGQRLESGQKASVEVDNSFLGVRAWGRTGCNGSGANCATGGCNGGLVCTDAGITSGVIVSEYGFADFGQWGGKRTSWDLSYVGLQINLDTKLVASDGQSVACNKGGCARNQAYVDSTDYDADRNSAPGTSFTHIFCANSNPQAPSKPQSSPAPKPKPTYTTSKQSQAPAPTPSSSSKQAPAPTSTPAPAPASPKPAPAPVSAPVSRKPTPKTSPPPAPATTHAAPPPSAPPPAPSSAPAAPALSSSSSSPATSSTHKTETSSPPPPPATSTSPAPGASGKVCASRTARRARSLARRHLNRYASIS